MTVNLMEWRWERNDRVLLGYSSPARGAKIDTCKLSGNQEGAQKEFLMEKSVGDVIAIKGKTKSIGEVIGYSIDIREVS